MIAKTMEAYKIDVQQATLDRYLSALPQGFGAVRPAALNEQMAAARPFILDVREAAEVTGTGAIAGAVNIPLRDLAKNLDRLPAKDQPIVAICSTGYRSAMAMMALQMLGYSNVKSLVGGFTAWTAAGLARGRAALLRPACSLVRRTEGARPPTAPCALCVSASWTPI